MLLPQLPIEQLRVVHIGGYWRGANDMVKQMLLGLQAAGPRVEEIDTDAWPEVLDTDGRRYDRGTYGPVWLRWELLASRVAAFDPHLIVCNAGGLGFRPEVAAVLRQSHTLLGIALSDPDVHAVATCRVAPGFDWFVTNDPGCVARYRALGVRSAALPPGTNDTFFRPVPPRAEMACEVLVLGRASPDRVEPVRALTRQFDVHLYGEGWEEVGLASRGLVFGEEALAALSSARMTVVFFRTPAGHPLLKVGLFDFLAAGALVLTDRSPLVSNHLRFGRELVGFDTTEELMTRVRHLLDHPAEAERIRTAGRERVRAEYSWCSVWRRVIAWLGDPREGLDRRRWWPWSRRRESP